MLFNGRREEKRSEREADTSQQRMIETGRGKDSNIEGRDRTRKRQMDAARATKDACECVSYL